MSDRAVPPFAILDGRIRAQRGSPYTDELTIVGGFCLHGEYLTVDCGKCAADILFLTGVRKAMECAA